jgi:Ca2+-binding RTX toxin-like protein
LTDAAGNESIPSNSLVINVLRKVTIDNVSSANQPLFISGRAEANAKVALALNNNVTVNVNADHNGNWTYDGSVRYIMIRKTLQPLTDGNSAFDANGIFTVGDVSIYDKFGNLIPINNISVSRSNGFTGDWDPIKATGSLLDGNHIKSTSFSEAWGKDINSTAGGEAWIQFNLGSSYALSEITVFARDAFGARLNNAQIFTSVNDMSQKTTNQLNADPNVNVINPINNLVNYPYNTIPMPEVKVNFQFSIQTITATETVSSLTNSTNATVNNNATSGNDSITGSSGADFIFGGMGNDTLIGREGLDHIQGGEGADLIFGGIGGSDTIGAGLEGDFLSGDAGDDTLYGSAGSDYIQGGEGSDSIIGGSGDDFVSGGQGSDTIDGGAGYDMISYRNFDYQNQSRPPNVFVDVNLSTGIATDNWGNTDTLLSIEAVEGSELNDSIVGSSSDEFLFGSQGNDTILGGGGSDHLQGGEGSDSITAVEYGDNFLSGDHGNDSINGGDGSDHIQGGEGSDLISGGSGDDFISGGAGIDILTGGIGHDIFLFNLGFQSISGSSATDVITDFVHGEDIFDFGIPISDIQFVSQTSVVSDLATLLDAFDTIDKTEGKKLFYFGVIDRDGNAGTTNDRDGYLVTGNYAGEISNIIQFSGVTSLDSIDIVGL